MTAERGVILLFEDDLRIVSDFKRLIRGKLGSDLVLEVFPLSAASPNTSSPYEDRVFEVISDFEYKGRIALIVTDRDLSTLADHWRGLSQAAVSVAARRLGIPVACYRSRKANLAEDFRRVPGDGLIELPADPAKRAKQVVVLARGFMGLAKHINAAHVTPSSKRDPLLSPGMLLATSLGQPAAAAHMDTFACGDQLAIGEILEYSRAGKRMSADVRKRLIAALGVWLADLVMKYPGVLVSSKAAASHLDIHPTSFMREDVQKLFARACYTHLPFADDEDPLWWRHLLDEIVRESGCSTGLELCAKKGLQRVRYCPCSVNPKLHAGFLDMATGEPISAENSSGRVRWFPPGADLARLNKSSFRRLGPWIGT